MKLLIISADDFGTSQTANETVDRLLRANAVTTTCIVTTAPSSADAAMRALELRVNAGIQWRMSPEMDFADGNEVMYELERQFNFLTDFGLNPDHAANPSDSLLDIKGVSYMTEVFMVCGGHGIPFRLPQTYMDLIPVSDPHTAKYMEAFTMITQSIVQNAWLLNVKLPKIVSQVFKIPDFESYDELREQSIKELGVLPDGISVMCFTPCDESDESKNLYPDWRRRAWEARLLTDPVFRAALERFKLADFTTAFSRDTYETDNRF